MLDDPKILIIGEYPSAEEERRSRPFTSESGMAFRTMLKKAGIPITSCRFVNVAKDHPLRNEMIEFFYPTADSKDKTSQWGLFPVSKMQTWLLDLEAYIAEWQPDFIIAAGSYALWALYGMTGEIKIGNHKKHKVPTGINNWRGSHLFTTIGGKTYPLLPVLDQNLTHRVYNWNYKTQHDLRVRYSQWKEGNWLEPATKFHIRPSFQQAKEHLLDLRCDLDLALQQVTQYKIACDVETFAGHITCIGFAWSATDAFCLPLLCKGQGEAIMDPYWNEAEELALVDLMRVIFTHPALKLSGQNFLYDAQHIAFSWQVVPYIAEDTMIQQHLIFPGTELNLAMLSSMYCGWHRYWKEDGKFWKKDDVEEEEYWIYNCRDCIVTYEVGDKIAESIKYYNQEEQWEFQIAQLQEILVMMLRGVNIDQEVKHIMKHELDAVTEKYEENLRDLLPEDVYEQPPKVAPWYRSTVQQTTIFTEIFGMKRYFNRKKKAYTMDGPALAEYARREPLLAELCNTLIEYNSLTTFKTFTEMKLGPDQRMRSSYAPTTITYRWRSSADAFGAGGNLQNLSKGNE